MSLDTIIKNVRVVRPGVDDAQPLDIGISDGRITRLDAEISADEANTVIDGKNRLAFPGLWEPREFEAGDGKPRYGCALLVPKSDQAQLAAVKDAIIEAGVANSRSCASNRALGRVELGRVGRDREKINWAQASCRDLCVLARGKDRTFEV